MTRKKINAICSLAILVFAVIVFIMFFLDNVKYTSGLFGDMASYTGAQVAFGYSEKAGNFSAQILQFSFMAFLTYLLPLAGTVLALVLGNAKGNLGMIGNIIAAACFLLGAIFMFCMPNFAISGDEAVKGLTLAYGAIVSGVMCILSLLITVGKILGKIFYK